VFFSSILVTFYFHIPLLLHPPLHRHAPLAE
jgi:hypothetical protein